MKMSWSIRLRWPWVIRRRLPAKMVEVIARQVVDEMLDDAAKAMAAEGWRLIAGPGSAPCCGLMIQAWKPGWRKPMTLVYEGYTSFYLGLYWRPSGIGKMQIDAGADKVTA